MEYKKGYEQGKGKLIGALSIEDDPKMIHCQKMAKQQSDVSTDKPNNMWFVGDMLNSLEMLIYLDIKSCLEDISSECPFWWSLHSVNS